MTDIPDPWPQPGYPGPAVHVYCERKSIPKDVRECISGRFLVYHRGYLNDPWGWPSHNTDFYVQRTRLTYESEKAAASMGAQIVVLPEQTEWLRAQISKLIGEERDVYIFRASRVGDRL